MIGMATCLTSVYIYSLNHYVSPFNMNVLSNEVINQKATKATVL